MADVVRYQSVISDSQRWLRFDHRPGDIVLSTPPKSGTTWMQMLCALLIFDGPVFPGTLDQLSPWLDQQTRSDHEVFGALADQTHRRFIKTHTPLDGLPLRTDVSYIVVARDPRDALVSFAHHRANLDRELLMRFRTEAVGEDDLSGLSTPVPLPFDPDERLRDFAERPAVRQPGASLADVLRHVQTAWVRRAEPNVALFHYADLTRDLPGEMERLARFLGIDLTAARLAELVPEAHLDRMRERAGEVAPDTTKNHWRDTRRFFRSGASGEWREATTAATRDRYDERVAELVEPDLAAWVHLGRIGSEVDPHA